MHWRLVRQPQPAVCLLLEIAAEAMQIDCACCARAPATARSDYAASGLEWRRQHESRAEIEEQHRSSLDGGL